MVSLRPASVPMAAVVIALSLGCASRGSTAVTARLRVGARPFALAEVARRVGLNRVVVADQGELVLTTGGDPDPWLDPVAMQRVTQLSADALSRADPGGRPSFQGAGRAYQAQLGSLDIDYRSSLADCARHDIVTADASFARLGTRYNFSDHVATDPGIAELVKAKSIATIFTEPGVSPAAVVALAQATHTRVQQLDTVSVRTPEEAARGATYLSLMTDNLAKLRAALGCTAPS